MKVKRRKSLDSAAVNGCRQVVDGAYYLDSSGLQRSDESGIHRIIPLDGAVSLLAYSYSYSIAFINLYVPTLLQMRGKKILVQKCKSKFYLLITRLRDICRLKMTIGCNQIMR